MLKGEFVRLGDIQPNSDQGDSLFMNLIGDFGYVYLDEKMVSFKTVRGEVFHLVDYNILEDDYGFWIETKNRSYRFDNAYMKAVIDKDLDELPKFIF